MGTDLVIEVLKPANLPMYVQAGGIVIALLTLLLLAGSGWLLYKLVTNHGAHFEKAIDRNTDAFRENTVAMVKMSARIDEQCNLLRSLVIREDLCQKEDTN